MPIVPDPSAPDQSPAPPPGDALGAAHPVGEPHPDPAALAEQLGMPADRQWVEMTTRGAVAPTAPQTPFYVRLSLGALGISVAIHSLPTAALRDWHGCMADVFGLLIPEALATRDPAAPPSLSIPPVHLEVWRFRAMVPGGPFYAEMRWQPGREPTGGLQLVHWRAPWSPEDLTAADKPLQLAMEYARRGGGRPQTLEAEAQDMLLNAARDAIASGCPLGKLRRADLGVQLALGERQVGNLLERAGWHMAILKREFARQFPTEGS